MFVGLVTAWLPRSALDVISVVLASGVKGAAGWRLEAHAVMGCGDDGFRVKLWMLIFSCSAFWWQRGSQLPSGGSF